MAPARAHQLIESAPPVSAHFIEAHAQQMGVALSSQQSAQLEGFLALLMRWNRTHNLTAITDAQQLLSHHLLDSLSLVAELPASAPLRILDAGAGAGLPGIPLAIALPSHQFTLVDAVAKKCAFTTQARMELGLSNVEVIHSRLEALRGPTFDASFDVIVSRALGSLKLVIEMSKHLLSPSGRWIAMKGHLPQDELRQLPPDVTAARTVALTIPLLRQARHLIVLQPRLH